MNRKKKAESANWILTPDVYWIGKATFHPHKVSNQVSSLFSLSSSGCSNSEIEISKMCMKT